MTSAPLRRRDVLAGSALALLAASPAFAAPAAAGASVAPSSVAGEMRRQAQALASRPWRAPDADLPPTLAALGYDAYRDLRYRPAKALWRGQGVGFEVQMFHRGGLFKDRVEMFEAVDGKIAPIAYSPDLFDFGPQKLGALPADLGFAGFRLHGPLNRADYLDEICAFLGASYFRAVGKGDSYGLSARGLAIGAAETGEEFPRFTRFVLERPKPGAAALMVHALLDSPSVAGAYSFRITPGQPTRFEVTTSLFPRRALANAGLAPLTSMYLFAAEQPRRFDDFRPQVHDSDGLSLTGRDGARAWRPLANPKQIETSVFAEAAAGGGFGLMQRERELSAYQDLEANYHLRPGAWVALLDGFDAGAVRLVELPAHSEGQDNIVASWRPGSPLAAGREHRFRYRIDWGGEPKAETARAMVWREGRGEDGGRRFVVDFGPVPENVTPRIVADKGDIKRINIQPNAAVRGVRLSFELQPGAAQTVELRANLWQGGRAASENWVYRWSA